jgi:integrase
LRPGGPARDQKGTAVGWITETDNRRYKARFRQSDGAVKSKTFDYQFEAEAWLEQVEGRLEAVARAAADLVPVYTPPPRPAATLGRRVPLLVEHAQSWERRRAGRQLAAQTRTWYAREVRRLEDSCLRHMRLDQVGKMHIETWLADLADAGKGASTIRAQLKVLRMILTDAVENDLIRKDPSARIPLPKTGKARHRVLEPAEDSRLLLAAKPDPRAGAFILAALDCGLRWAEIAGLGHHSVELDAQMLAVWQVVDRETGELRPYPKDHEPRRVPMTQRLTDALRPIAAAAAEKGGHGLLFTTATGRPLDYWNWARDFWYPAREAAQLAAPLPRFHDLRHTYATRLHRANVPTREIGTVLGHADEHITATYVHEMDERARGRLIRSALARYG